MAAIDYGALLRVNGEFVNKNQHLFMETSDTGYTLKEAFFKDRNVYDKAVPIEGNFYVYAGDADLLLAFYKGYFYIISNGEILKAVSYSPFLSESFLIHDTEIKISHLDRIPIIEKPESQTWKSYVRENWIDATGDEKLSELDGGQKAYRRFLCQAKRRSKGRLNYKYFASRWKAEWEHGGKSYEVIFGYGIDPDEEVWNQVKTQYDFSDREIRMIDRWFLDKSHA